MLYTGLLCRGFSPSDLQYSRFRTSRRINTVSTGDLLHRTLVDGFDLSANRIGMYNCELVRGRSHSTYNLYDMVGFDLFILEW